MTTAVFVYIVGAGPGDPDLITVKGRRAVRNADVILHDRLIHPDLLLQARPNADVIDVGKRRGREDARQLEIHRLMIDYARQGKVVCRLKGGDPFVFGRAGEEMEALLDAGIAFEIIPGVTSVTAATAAALVPLTHRNYTHGFLTLTGSRSVNFTTPEWEAARTLLRAGGTVVVLMGAARIEEIVGHLIGQGCSPQTPAAIIAKGTWADQRVWFGNLENIGGVGRPSPALVVFGKVVAFAQDCNQRLASISR